jgi:hypothetical protein
MRDEKKTAFEASADGKDAGLFREFLDMMKQNKNYWLIPLVLLLLALGVLVILGSTGAAPFIYTLF